MEKIKINIGDIVDIGGTQFTVTSIETNNITSAGNVKCHTIYGVNEDKPYVANLYVDKNSAQYITLINSSRLTNGLQLNTIETSYLTDKPSLFGSNSQYYVREMYVNNDIVNNKLIEVSI